MHAAYVGRASCYSSWPQSSVDRNTSMFDLSTADQPTSTVHDRALPHVRPPVSANPGPPFLGGGGGGGTVGEFHLPSSAPIANVAPPADVKLNPSCVESFRASDVHPPSTNFSSNLVDGFVAPLPLPPHHSRCPPSVVDAAAGQSFSPLPAFAGYPFPVLAPAASTAGLVPPGTAGYRLALGTTASRGRIQRQNGAKSSTKLASPSRTRSHAGSYSHSRIIRGQFLSTCPFFDLAFLPFPR